MHACMGGKREWMDELMTRLIQTKPRKATRRCAREESSTCKFCNNLYCLCLPARKGERERERRAISEMGFGFLSFPLIPSRARTTREETTHQIKSCEKW
jgi:hypothetical protein